MLLLELFAGTGSVGNVGKNHGYDVISLDISNNFSKTDIMIDILLWDYTKLNKNVDIIWASPPCSTFSTMKQALIGKHGITTESIENDINTKGIPLLKKTLEIIKYFKPKAWFIENPLRSQMSSRNLVTLFGSEFDISPIYKYTTSYCHYGYEYMKDTCIWSNNPSLNHLKKCRLETPCLERQQFKTHRVRIGYTNSLNLEQRYSIPSLLIADIFKKIKNQV